ncbi:MAG: hypothetical protein ACK56I_08950, partial [bacterium]
MGHRARTGSGLRRRPPVPGQEFVHRGAGLVHAHGDVGEVAAGLDPVQDAGGHDGERDRPALAADAVADEPRLLAQQRPRAQ